MLNLNEMRNVSTMFTFVIVMLIYDNDAIVDWCALRKYVFIHNKPVGFNDEC